MIFFSLLLTLIGMVILYRCSSKQQSNVHLKYQKIMTIYQVQFRILAFLLFLISGSLLCWIEGISIGFVSWWIFATPITFLLVLKINHVLTPRVKHK